MEKSEYQRLPFIQNPLEDWEAKKKKSSFDSSTEKLVATSVDEVSLDTPQFRHYEETSNIQLFFDLFFVANLTSFTNAHEINSKNTLTTYVGFFTILWFTWCQVTLYDVRFATDSILERVAHACHFGVMVGFAIVGPKFNSLTSATPWGSLQSIALILMVSRFILVVQYGATLVFVWKYKRARLPMLGVMASLFLAVLVYMVCFLTFRLHINGQVQRAFYAMAVVEVALNICIAAYWRVLSFKGSNLVERMSSLTLIILGEGIIGLTKSIVKIEELDFDFTASAIGSIISAVLIIYIYYQLYFDNLQSEHFGTIRQQVWAFAHYPFHVALVLVMEGTNQFVSWRHVIEYTVTTFAQLNAAGDALENGTATATDYFIALNETFYRTIINGNFSVLQETVDKGLADLAMLDPSGSQNSTAAVMASAIDDIVESIFSAIFNNYDFEPPESDTNDGQTQTLDDIITSYFKVFETIFAYFFISAGLTLIGIGALSTLSLLPGEWTENRWKWVGISSCFLLGLGTTLLSLMNLTSAAENLGESAFTLVVLLLVLIVTLVLNHVPKKKRGFKEELTI